MGHLSTSAFTLRLLLIFALCYTSPLCAQNDKKLALIMGNAAYEHGGVLKNPVNDANLMARTLVDMNFDVIKRTNGSLKDMQMAFKEFVSRLDDYDVALFFYAGHGMQVDGQNYLIPIDAKLNDQMSIEFEAFKVSSVNKYFAYNGDKLNIMILDACRNNPYRAWSRSGAEGFNAVKNQGAGTIIAFATREGQTASDGTGNNGLFTQNLVEQMKIPQNITDVFQNTRVNVLQKSNKQQVPQEWNMLTGNFYFTEVPTEPITVEEDPIIVETQPDVEESTFVSGEVSQAYGSIIIDTHIAGDLYLDGKKLGFVRANSKGNQLNKIKVGKHVVKVEGASIETAEIEVYKDRASTLVFKREVSAISKEAVTKVHEVKNNEVDKPKEIVTTSRASKIETFLIPVKTKSSWGYMNQEEKMVIPAMYKTGFEFSKEGFAPVLEGRDFYFIDRNGTKLATEISDYELKPGSGGFKGFKDGMVPVSQRGNRWGFMNTSGKLVVPMKYEHVTEFEGGFAVVRNEKIFMVIDKEGKETHIDRSILNVKEFSEGLARFQGISKRWGFMGTDGKIVITDKFLTVGKFSNGLAMARGSNKQLGYINKQGDWAIEPTFFSAKEFDPVSKLARIKKQSGWCYTNTKGEFMYMNETDIWFDFSDGLAKGHDNRAGRFGYFDETGNWVISAEFEAAHDFKNGYASVRKNGKWGVIDKKGDWVIEPVHAEINNMQLLW